MIKHILNLTIFAYTKLYENSSLYPLNPNEYTFPLFKYFSSVIVVVTNFYTQVNKDLVN